MANFTQQGRITTIHGRISDEDFLLRRNSDEFNRICCFSLGVIFLYSLGQFPLP